MAGLAGVVGKGLRGYMEGRRVKLGDENAEKDRARQAEIDRLDRKRVEAGIQNDNARTNLARRSLDFDQTRFSATHGLARDRFAADKDQLSFGNEATLRGEARQAELDALNEELMRSNMSRSEREIALRERGAEIDARVAQEGMTLRRDQFNANQDQRATENTLATNRDARAGETHEATMANVNAELERDQATSQIMSGALAETRRAHEQGGGDFSDYMGTVYAPMVANGILATTGDVALANQWKEWAKTEKAQQNFRLWDQARFALEGGDYETALDLAATLYNDHVPDGYTADLDGTTVIKDSRGNVIQAVVKFKGPDGQEMEQVFDDVEGFFRQALPMLDPMAAFQAQIDSVGRADDVRVARSADVRERQEAARAAVVDMLSEPGLNGAPAPITQETEASIAAIYKQYGLDADGQPLPAGRERDVEADAPFADLR